MIEDALKRLSKHSLIYALGPAVQRVIGFALLPLVTAYIGSTGNYGIVELSATMLAVGGQLFGINLVYGMSRYYNDYADERDRARLVSTTWIMLAASTGSAVLLAWLFRDPGAKFFFGSSAHADAFVLVAAILFFQTLAQVNLRYLQILERSVAYGVLTTVKLLCEVGLKIWFLVALKLAFLGVLYSVLGCEALIAVGLGAFMLRRLGLSFSWPMAQRLLRYSYPLILSGTCMFVLHQADRFFIERMCGLGEVGIYGLGYKFGSIANVVFLEAFGLIWFPYIFSVQDDQAVRLICRKVLTYFNLLMCVASLGLAMFSVEIVTVMAPPEYLDAHRALPIIVLGYVFWAIFQLVHTAFYIRERTLFVTLLVAGAAILNLVLNAVLIRELGYIGAAWATLATFGVLALFAWILAERVMPVAYEVGRVFLPIALGAGLFGASAFLPDGPRPATLALKLLLVLALPAILWFAGYLEASEKDKIKLILVEARASILRRARRSSS